MLSFPRDPAQPTPKLGILKFRKIFHKIIELTDHKKKRWGNSEILLFEIGFWIYCGLSNNNQPENHNRSLADIIDGPHGKVKNI